MCVVLREVYSLAGNSAVFVQAEDGIRDLVRSRGLGDVYKRQVQPNNGAHAQVDDLEQVAAAIRGRAEAVILCGLKLSLLHI